MRATSRAGSSLVLLLAAIMGGAVAGVCTAAFVWTFESLIELIWGGGVVLAFVLTLYAVPVTSTGVILIGCVGGALALAVAASLNWLPTPATHAASGSRSAAQVPVEVGAKTELE